MSGSSLYMDAAFAISKQIKAVMTLEGKGLLNIIFKLITVCQTVLQCIFSVSSVYQCLGECCHKTAVI